MSEIIKLSDKDMNRFLSKIEFPPDDFKEDACWIWKGTIIQRYGYFRLGSRLVRAHKLSYLIFNGEIIDRFFVLHECNVKLCVNPAHLYLGDSRDNLIDAMNDGAWKNWGDNHVMAKLTQEQVYEIKKLYESGNFTQQELANKFNCSQSNISLIIMNKKWQGVPIMVSEPCEVLDRIQKPVSTNTGCNLSSPPMEVLPDAGVEKMNN